MLLRPSSLLNNTSLTRQFFSWSKPILNTTTTTNYVNPTRSKHPLLQSSFTSLSSALANNQLPPRLKLNDADLTVSYLKGTGPGGQKINKTNSAVQIIHKPTGIVVKSQATRSRSQNEKIARQLLADKIEALQKGDQSRVAIKAERARKKKASKMKKSRRKYRQLEEGSVQEEEEEEERGEEEREQQERQDLPQGHQEQK